MANTSTSPLNGVVILRCRMEDFDELLDWIRRRSEYRIVYHKMSDCKIVAQFGARWG